MATRIRAVIFDWAGTTVDFGSRAPMEAFRAVFAEAGVPLSDAEIRGPMGLHKKDHIRALLQQATIAARWQATHGHAWTEADVEALYQRFIPLQLEVIEGHSQIVPGLLTCVEQLRQRQVKIGSTTGYFPEATALTVAAARAQGYAPDCVVCPDQSLPGRPWPWMIFRNMQLLEVCPPAAVVKVGDTVVDMHEGRNAGAWCVGVTTTSNLIGLSEAQWAEQTPQQRDRARVHARAQLLAAGAHWVIDTLDELPLLLDSIQ